MISGGEAFGRYLRTLRGRQGLSLSEVAQFSSEHPIPIDKGTLSRFERGKQRMPLTALAPISHLYCCPADVLMERLELDTELDGLGGPEIRDQDYANLRLLGRSALLEGDHKWTAYAYFREAEQRARTDCDTDDQRTAQLNLATVARSLGKNRLALHEFLELESRGSLPDSLASVLQDRIANCYRCLGDYELAEHHLDEAVDQAHFYRDSRALAFALYSRGDLAIHRGETQHGIDELSQAFRANREAAEKSSSVAHHPSFETETLLKIADSHVRLGNYAKAGRAALAAKRLAARVGAQGPLAYSEMALGEVDDLIGQRDRALQRFRQAEQVGRLIRNRRLRFLAEFYTFRQAVMLGNRSLAIASQRRISRLIPWVPAHLLVLDEYDELTSGKRLADHGTRSNGAKGTAGRRTIYKERS